MTTDLIPLERLPLQVQGVSTLMEGGKLSDPQKDLIRQTLGKGCPKEDLDLFFWTCDKYGLNPFGVAQIYGVPRNERVKDERGNWGNRKRLTTQVGINGLVKIAERSGQFRGMTLPEWCRAPRVNGKIDPDAEPRWRNVWLYDDPPDAAKVGVWRANGREPSWGIALWRESVDLDEGGNPRNLWKSKPALMLAKTAAALALRRTFQAEFAELRASFEPALDAARGYARIDDLYGPEPGAIETTVRRPAIAEPSRNFFEHEAIPHVERGPEPAANGNGHAGEQPRAQANGVKRITDAQRRALFALAGEDALREAVMQRYGLEHLDELSISQASELIEAAKAGLIRPPLRQEPAPADPPLFPEHDLDEPPPYDDADMPSEQTALDLDAARAVRDPDSMRPKARR